MMRKKIMIVLLVLALIVVFKNQISLGLMYVVDTIGYITGRNVVDIIDFLNTIYYL
jgi:hypothetical protein